MHVKSIIVSLLIISLTSQAQLGTNINTIVPKSPDASAVEKVNSATVSTYTGAANVAIPLFTLEDKNMNIPVSLSYSTTGIKVDQISSSVGIGWALNCGGVVTRQIRGLPDAEGVSRAYPPNDCQVLNQTLKDYLDDISSSSNLDTDAQPDLFTYQFAGYNGSFYINNSGDAVELNKTNLKIEIELDGGVTDSKYNCTITTPDGIKYYFQAQENTFSETIGSGYTGTLPILNYAQTSAYLSTIQHPVYGTISISYYSVNTECFTGIQQSYERNDPNNSTYCSPTNSVLTFKSKTYYQNMKFVQEISNSSGGKLVFGYANRSDFQGAKLLTTVSLYSGTVKLKSATLEYDLVQASTPGNFSTELASDTTLLRRPYLKNVRFFDKNEQEINNYKLAYYAPQDLPSRLSFKQDHLGFYNASSNSNYFIPAVENNPTIASYFPLATADREPNSVASKKGSLSSITYPTGGIDSFEYELPYATYEQENILTNNLHLVVQTNSSQSSNNGSSSSVALSNVNNEPSLLQVRSLVTTSNGNPPDTTIDYLHYEVYDVTTSSVFQEGYLKVYDRVNSLIYNLTPGHSYQLNLDVLMPDSKGIMDLTYPTGTQLVQTTKLLPGQRVKKIITSDQFGTTSIRKFYYSFINNLDSSSATGYLPPQYLTSYIMRRLDPDFFSNGSIRGYVLSDCKFYRLNSNSVINVYANSPNGIQYKSIIEGFGENFENGAIEHQYETHKDKSADKLLGINNNMLFTGINTNRGYITGAESYTASYKKSGGVLEKISDTRKYFNLDSRVEQNGYGYEITKYFDHPVEYNDWVNLDGYDVRKYELRTRWAHLDSVVNKVYSNATLVAKTVFEYNNANHQMPTKTINYTSDGKMVAQEIKYSSDYTGITATDIYSAGVHRLQLTDITTAPVEVITTIKQGEAAEKFKSALLAVYDGTIPVKKQIEQVETNSLLTSFTRSSISSGAFQKDSRYKPQLKFVAYDSYKNILTQQKENDVLRSYIWDYNATYPIAEVTNAPDIEVAYCSFEADGTGNWSGINASYIQSTGGITGNKYYNQSSFSLSKSGLNSSSYYIVSYWSKNGSYSISGTQSGYPKTLNTITTGGNTWSLYEHLVTGQTNITVSGTGAIDELRLYPKGSLMTTYTYNPLIGMSSQSDASGHIIYYEYDDFGRLKLARDQNQNVVKKYEYKYASAN